MCGFYIIVHYCRCCGGFIRAYTIDQYNAVMCRFRYWQNKESFIHSFIRVSLTVLSDCARMLKGCVLNVFSMCSQYLSV